MGLTHLAFATYELHPVNSGGAGVLIAGAIRTLARAGYRCTVICHFPDEEVARAQRLLARESFQPGSIRLVSAASLVGGRRVGARDASPYEHNSALFATAVRQLHRADPIDVLEFPEYAGIGYEALRQRLAEGALAGVKIAVRAHGSLEFIDQVEGVGVGELSRARMHRMERLALKLADFMLVPSDGMGAVYREAYGLEARRVVLSPPPMEQLLRTLAPPVERLVDPAHFLFYGKLQEVKGIDLFLEAAGSLVTEAPGRHWRFTIIGRDTECAAHRRKVSECIAPLVPGRHATSFEFLDGIDRAQLSSVARGVAAAVVPSRFETFCLAAHELRAVGLPLIVPRIPGFRDYLNEATGCLTYDGSASGLRQAMLRVREEAGLSDALAAAPRPTYRPFRDAYDEVASAALAPARAGIERSVLLHEVNALGNLRAREALEA